VNAKLFGRMARFLFDLIIHPFRCISDFSTDPLHMCANAYHMYLNSYESGEEFQRPPSPSRQPDSQNHRIATPKWPAAVAIILARSWLSSCQRAKIREPRSESLATWVEIWPYFSSCGCM